MNQAQAKRKLKELARGEYHSLEIKWTYYNTNKKRKCPKPGVQCGVYIDERGWHYAPTWEEAFEKLEEKLKESLPKTWEQIKLEEAINENRR